MSRAAKVLVVLAFVVVTLAGVLLVRAEEESRQPLDTFGPLVSMFCRTEHQIRDAVHLQAHAVRFDIAVGILRKRYGKESCGFGRINAVKLLHVQKPERKLFSGQFIIAEIEIVETKAVFFTYVISHISEEDV